MKTKQILSLDQLESLGSCKNSVYSFDLSLIDIDYLDSLFDSIYFYAKKSIKGLGFNLDLSIKSTLDYFKFRKTKAAQHKQHHPQPELESSCFKNRPKLMQELIGLISRFLPQSDSIQKLKFRAMPFTFQDIDVLSQSIQQCSCLRELTLNNIPLSDEGFFSLALALRKRSVIKLKCRNCKLTDNISETVASLIQFHTNIQKEAEKKAEQEKNPNLGIICLSNYDFRDNNLTNEFIHAIEHDVEFSPITSFDVRGNLQITESSIASSKFYFGPNSSEPREKPEPPESREIILERENRNLKETLKNLVGGQRVVMIMDDLYAIGNRSQELLSHIKQLDEFCGKLENQQFYNRTLSRGSPKINITPISTFLSNNQSWNPSSANTSDSIRKYPYPRKSGMH